MKKLILIITFIFLFALSAFGQCSDIEDCNKKLSDAAQMVEKLLAIQERDEKAYADKVAEVASLKIVVAEMERAKQTPCTIAAEKLKLDFAYWLSQYDGASPEKRKQIDKIIKFTRKNGRRSLEAQCGYKSDSLLGQLWGAAKIGLPIAAILF